VKYLDTLVCRIPQNTTLTIFLIRYFYSALDPLLISPLQESRIDASPVINESLVKG